MASVIMAPTFCSISVRRSGKDWSERSSTNGQHRGMNLKAMRIEKPLEELYQVRVEREVSQERLAELGVSRWSMWKTGKCKLPWDWQVDQLVYIEEGEVRVVPEGSRQYGNSWLGILFVTPSGWRLTSGSTALTKSVTVSEPLAMISRLA